MNKVAITAFGATKFSQDDLAINDMMFDSIKSLFENSSNVQKDDIDVVLVSTNDDTKYQGAIISEMVGIQPKISHNIESMCSSGTNAIVSAYSYIASGLAKTALVVGADRFDGPGQILHWDAARGEFMHPIFWASIFSKAYKTRFGLDSQGFASIAAKNHKNAQDNPNAISDKAHTVTDVINSKKLTDDLRLLECSRPSTGSAALLLSADDIASKVTDTPIWISGIGQKTTAASFTKTADFTKMQSTIDAVGQAFSMSKIDAGQIDVAEVHDAFAVCEALAVEDIGMAKKGFGAKFADELYQTGNKMINPRGGLIGSGHPLGATGIAQTIEIVEQLQNNAAKRQVPDAKTGLVHNMSAAATSSTVLVLSR